MSHNVSLHRMLKASPEKVFRDFTHPSAIASWLPPYGFLCVVHEMNAEKGGTYRMSFENFSTGHSHSFGGRYLEIKPSEFLKYTDKFDDPNLPGEMTTTVSFRKTIAGTELKITQDGIPAAIPAEMCYLGWQESLDKLMRLVEQIYLTRDVQISWLTTGYERAEADCCIKAGFCNSTPSSVN